MTIKARLKMKFGDTITKVTIKNKVWLFVEIDRPVHREYEDAIVNRVEEYCRENWDYERNISVGWGY